MSKKVNKHWTEEKNSFQFYIADEFIDALERRLDELKMSHKMFAKKLNVSEGRVSQIFNNPGNLTISKMIEWARIIGLKVAVLAYNDGDPDNVLGPVTADVFTGVWEIHDKPRDYEDLQYVEVTCGNCENGSQWNLNNKFKDSFFIQEKMHKCEYNDSKQKGISPFSEAEKVTFQLLKKEISSISSTSWLSFPCKN